MNCPNCNNETIFIDGTKKSCSRCGYFTDSSLLTELNINRLLTAYPKIVNDIKVFDGTSYWIPMILHVNNIATLTPNGTPDNWHWSIITYEPIPLLERVKYPIEGKPDSFYETRMIESICTDYKDGIDKMTTLIR